MSKLQYRLFIVLYADVIEGDMSFADSVAILKLNGIEIATLNSWNENGEIIIDYDNLEEVRIPLKLLIMVDILKITVNQSTRIILLIMRV